MMFFPRSLSEARSIEGRIQAGGTDEHALRRRGLVGGPVLDLRDILGLDAIEPLAEGGLRIGAKVTLAQLASDEKVREGWPALAMAAAETATPQIRRRATIAGNLLQQVRCWYFRNPEFPCLKKGGSTCFARDGDHSFHSLFDHSSCVAPHPSTLACALWALDGQVRVSDTLRTIPELLGDGVDPRRTHNVEVGRIITDVVLPPSAANERSAYVRTIHRARAEWPLVEAAVRIRLMEGTIKEATLVAGAVAVRPVRFAQAAKAMVGLKPQHPRINEILASLPPSAPPLPQAAFKARLLTATLRAAMDRALTNIPGPSQEAP